MGLIGDFVLLGLTLTAAASFAASGSTSSLRKPIRLPSMREQVTSSPIRLANSSKPWTELEESRTARSSETKSSVMAFCSGRNLLTVLALVNSGVSRLRKWCHVSPCL